jgi:hypothetical protein
MKMETFTDTLTIEGQQVYNGVTFPLILGCRRDKLSLDEAVAGIRANRETLDARLKESGTILFRGFPIAGAEDFDAFVSAFDFPLFTFDRSLSNAVRVNVTPKVFTANEAPASVVIRLHHEMAQTPTYPSRIFFYCETSPSSGGATPLCPSDELFRRLQEKEPDFARNCEEKGLLYTHVMPMEDNPESGMGRSWKSTLSADTKEVAEERLRSLNYTWQWETDDALRVTTPVLPAVREVAPGRKTYFNQLIAFYAGKDISTRAKNFGVTHGDGTKLDHRAANHAVEIAEELCFDVRWQAGDVALVDNFLVMHGRRAFEGTRRVLASLVAA